MSAGRRDAQVVLGPGAGLGVGIGAGAAVLNACVSDQGPTTVLSYARIRQKYCLLLASDTGTVSDDVLGVSGNAQDPNRGLKALFSEIWSSYESGPAGPLRDALVVRNRGCSVSTVALPTGLNGVGLSITTGVNTSNTVGFE